MTPSRITDADIDAAANRLATATNASEERPLTFRETDEFVAFYDGAGEVVALMSERNFAARRRDT